MKWQNSSYLRLFIVCSWLDGRFVADSRQLSLDEQVTKLLSRGVLYPATFYYVVNFIPFHEIGKEKRAKSV